MAYLKERAKKWYAVWRVNGCKVVKATGVAVKNTATKKMAQTIADALESAAKNTSTIDNAIDMVKTTAAALGFAQATRVSIYEFLNTYKAGGKEQSQRNYARAINRFFDYLAEDKMKPLDSLKPSRCEGFFKKECERVSYGTARHYISMLRAAFSSAHRDDLIRKNPFASLDIRRSEVDKRKTKRLPFTPEEMHIIMTTFPQHWRELVMTSFLTGGQRLGDCCTLKWSSVDLQNGVISFSTGKTGRTISAPIVAPLRDLLESKERESEYVFPEMARRYNRRSTLSVEFTSLLRAHGILPESDMPKQGDRRPVAQKSFHSIRHTVVSMLRSSAMFSADLTREIVGHSSEAIERAYYTAADDLKRQGLLYLANQTKLS